MEQFARTIIGYHGCSAEFAHDILLGQIPINAWKLSNNDWDWLGHGIYFWEHSPHRALRWAQENHVHAAVVGAVVQLGNCFDLMDESVTAALAVAYESLLKSFTADGRTLPINTGPEWKARKLDCLLINDCLDGLSDQDISYDTVRGAFLEGAPVYPGAGFSHETHIQVSVRNSACILGVFKPNL